MLRCLLFGHENSEEIVLVIKGKGNLIRKGKKVGIESLEKEIYQCERCRTLFAGYWDLE